MLSSQAWTKTFSSHKIIWNKWEEVMSNRGHIKMQKYRKSSSAWFVGT